MSVTISQVRRAVEETSTAIQDNPKLGSLTLQTALSEVLGSPTALTLIANSINQKTGATLQLATEVEFDRQGVRSTVLRPTRDPAKTVVGKLITLKRCEPCKGVGYTPYGKAGAALCTTCSGQGTVEVDGRQASRR